MKKEVNDPTLGHLGLFGCNGRLIKRAIRTKSRILLELACNLRANEVLKRRRTGKE